MDNLDVGKKVFWGMVILSIVGGLTVWKKIKNRKVTKPVPNPDNGSPFGLSPHPGTIEVKLTGVTFADRQNIIKTIPIETVLTLIHDTTNPVSKNAIGIVWNGKVIGYLPDHDEERDPVKYKGQKSVAKRFLDLMNTGTKLKVVGWKRIGGTADKPSIGLIIWIKTVNENSPF